VPMAAVQAQPKLFTLKVNNSCTTANRIFSRGPVGRGLAAHQGDASARV